MTNNAKEDLYSRVDKMREHLGIISYDAPVNTLELCAKKISDVKLIYHAFDTAGFCGAAFAGDKMNTIVLNSNRSEIEQNFDCGHELIHLVRHRNRNSGIFNCTTKNQNSFLEWEANEGSAQFIIPYQDFIPRFSKLFNSKASGIQRMLAMYYHVTTQVINVRLNSLAYEIDQYLMGTHIENIELLARRQRKMRGIQTTNYQALCDYAITWDSVIWL